MATVPKRVTERFTKSISKFKRILEQADDRDVNEADTVSIVKGILAETFGYDKYAEITGEYAIRGTYCDLAIILDGKVQTLIEVKAIDIKLKEVHMSQAISYGAREGISWVVLTNGLQWNLYKIVFEKPIKTELVVSFEFRDLSPRKKEDQENLYLLSKEGLQKGMREARSASIRKQIHPRSSDGLETSSIITS